VGYVTKGMKAAGMQVSSDEMVAMAIPLIAVGVWIGIRRLHRAVLASVD
jgi:uncharacterized membrane-anchored protein